MSVVFDRNDIYDAHYLNLCEEAADSQVEEVDTIMGKVLTILEARGYEVPEDEVWDAVVEIYFGILEPEEVIARVVEGIEERVGEKR